MTRWTRKNPLATVADVAPNSAVTSVAAKTGAVTLAEGDITNLVPDLARVTFAATPVKTAAYTAAPGDLIPADATSAGFTVTLPTAPADKSRIVVKKIDVSVNTVTIAAGGSDVFNKTGGATTLSLTLQFQAVQLQYASSTSIWYVVSTDVPLGSIVTPTGAVALTNKDLTSGTNTFPTFNQNTTGSAAKLTTARTINTVPFDGSANIVTNGGQWAPSDYGMIAWAFDIMHCGLLASVNGYLNLVGLKIPVATTITNVILGIGTAGATLTTGQNFAALYQGGSLLAGTADQATNWQSTGAKVMALTTPQAVTAGLAYVAFYTNGTTPPAFFKGALGGTGINVNLSSPSYRSTWTNNGLTTTLPSTLGPMTQATTAYWAAVS